MSQRFTVSKSGGERRPSDIQGEVNQLFEGDDPPASGGAEAEDAAEVVLVLKGSDIAAIGFHSNVFFYHQSSAVAVKGIV
ncbi:unnamed protein product [Pleuronectes platessa]|uniref:Uncharacterized protein n=1 Tax=Pleuronectes platessa TaxID=8262 RepID=A0A9N7ZF79_PLEPL|nr:unnamed protein product [Pleuronectes platessa]